MHDRASCKLEEIQDSGDQWGKKGIISPIRLYFDGLILGKQFNCGVNTAVPCPRFVLEDPIRSPYRSSTVARIKNRWCLPRTLEVKVDTPHVWRKTQS